MKQFTGKVDIPVPSKEKVQVRLSLLEYNKLEAQVLSKLPRETDAGSLGIRVGVELALRELRNGFTIGN